MENEIIEKIILSEGALIISQHCMALQTPNGVSHPVDLDEYGVYQPIQELIRLIPSNGDLTEEITENTRRTLRQAFLGEYPLFSLPLVGAQRKKEDILRILDVMNPQTQDDFVRTLCLVYSEGLYTYERTSYPFVCREDLRCYLCPYISKEHLFGLSEAVRKGLFYDSEDNSYIRLLYREELMLLPDDVVELFSRIKYLPRKSIIRIMIRYAIIIANVVIG